MFEHKNSKGILYYLYTKTVNLRGGGRQQVIYFFSKDKNAKHTPVAELPKGYEIVESKATALPCLRKKR